MGGAAGLIWGGLVCNCHTALSEKQKHADRQGHERELTEKKQEDDREFLVSGVLLEPGTLRMSARFHGMKEDAEEEQGNFQTDGKRHG